MTKEQIQKMLFNQERTITLLREIRDMMKRDEDRKTREWS